MIWRNYFCDLSASFESEDDILLSVADMHETSFKHLDYECCDAITVEDVEIEIKRLANGKSPGMDNITNEHMKNGGGSLVKHLSRPFNSIINLEYSPIGFRSDVTVPIFKKNGKDKKNPSNYRGITLILCVGKVFEKNTLNSSSLIKENFLIHCNSVLQEGGATSAIFVLRECSRECSFLRNSTGEKL